jgi:hypothetical protein
VSIENIVDQCRELMQMEPGYRAIYIQIVAPKESVNQLIKNQYKAAVGTGISHRYAITAIRWFYRLSRYEVRKILK